MARPLFRAAYPRVAARTLLALGLHSPPPPAGDPASPAGKPELVLLFLQWDVCYGGLAILAWAAFVYVVAVPERGFLRGVVPKVLAYGVAGGPVAVATMLIMERDAAFFFGAVW